MRSGARRLCKLLATCCWVLAIMAASASGAPTFTISGYVQTSGGAGVGGVNVTGDNGGGSAVTGVDGSYSLTVSNHWSGTIAVSKAGWLITPASKTYNRVSANLANENYISYQPKISGYIKRDDGVALSGATVETTDGISTTTNESGYYEIVVPYGWSGATIASLDGCTFYSLSYTNVTADQTNQNFTGYQPKISGHVRKADGTALSGASITASGAGSVTTNSSGYYEVYVRYGWSGTVNASLAGYSFTAKNYSNLKTNPVNQDFTGFQPIVSGTITAYGQPIEGVTLIASNGGPIGITNSAGYYSILVPYLWSGTITPSKLQYTFTTVNKNYYSLREDITSQNYTAILPPVSISGFVFDRIGNGVAGVNVSATNGGGNVLTDSFGAYSLSVPYNWSGSVTGSKTGYQITANFGTLTNIQGNLINKNFTAFQPKISGTILDTFESPLAVVRIVLSTGPEETVTDSNGNYNIIVPFGWSGWITPETDGYKFIADKKYYNYVQVDIANQNYTGYPNLFISGYVYNSDNIGVAGVTISDNSGELTTLSDANGYYSLKVYYSWSGTIKASHAAMAFAPDKTFVNLSTDVNGQDFHETLQVRTVRSQIQNSSDDGYYWIRTDVGGTTSGQILSDVEVGISNLYFKMAGFRFNSVSIAKGARILSSHLYLYCQRDSGTGIIQGSIYGENSDNPPTFSSTNPISSRPHTGGVGWNLTINGVRGYIESPDISEIIEQIISRSGWNQGCPMVMFYIPYAYQSGSKFMEFNDMSDIPTNSAIMEIIYEYSPLISGYVKDVNGAAMRNVEVKASNGGGSAVTDSIGYYSLRVPGGWSGIVSTCLFKPVDSFGRVYTNLYSDRTAQNFTVVPAWVSLSGYVRKSDGTAISNVKIQDGNRNWIVWTDSSGFYSINVPFNWDGTIWPSLSNFIILPMSMKYSGTLTDQINQNYLARTPIISGYVKTAAGQFMDEVNVTFSGIGSTITDVNGSFSFEVPVGWSGTMSLSKTGMESKIINFVDVRADITSTYFVNVTYGGGTGDANNPFKIGTAEHLYWLSKQPLHFAKNFIMVNDIDMNEPQAAGFVGIGGYNGNGIWNPSFSGNFDGGGHVIRNLKITGVMQMDQVGLFSCIQLESGKTSVIKNVGLVNAHISGEYAFWGAATLVGRVRPDGNVVIKNCWSDGGKVDGEKGVGGLLGFLEGNVTVRNCWAKTAVQTDNGGGGLIGYLNGGKVSNCWAVCDVNTSMYDVGGLIGAACFSEVNDCYVNGMVRGNNGIGGFAGLSAGGKINRCYADANVSGTIFVGGFVGHSEWTPSDFNACFWDRQTSPDVNGIGNAQDANVVGKTAEEMKTAATFMDAGWDFAGETANGTADIWTICEGTNTPKFVWEIAPGDLICPDGVNLVDFAFFAERWLNTDCQSSNNCEGADLDKSGNVDMGDLLEFASWWMEGI